MPQRLPRDPKQLLQETSARISARDIQRLHDLRDKLQTKWWEQVVWLLLFPSALGVLITIMRLVETSTTPGSGDRVLHLLLWVWGGMFVLLLVTYVEILSNRHRAMRRYIEEMGRQIDALTEQVTELQRERRQAAGSSGAKTSVRN